MKCLWEKFINAKAQKSININYRARKKAEKQIDALKIRLNQGDPENGPASSTLLSAIDTAAGQVLSVLGDPFTRFKGDLELSALAEFAIKERASVHYWASQYQPFMEFYKTEEDRAQNRVNYKGRKWWQKMIGWSN